MKCAKLYVLVCIGLLVASCAGRQPMRARYDLALTQVMQTEFDEGERFYDVRSYALAKQSYTNFIQNYAYNELTDRARLRIGQIDVRLGRPAMAMTVLEKASRGVFHTEVTPLVHYYLMLASYRLGKMEEAWGVLSRVRWSATRAKTRILIASLGIHIGQMRDKSLDDLAHLYFEILDTYVILTEEIRPMPEWLVKREEARRWIRRWVDISKMPEPQLKALFERFHGKSSGGYLLYKLAITVDGDGSEDSARDYFSQYVQAYPKHEYIPLARMKLAELGRKLDDSYVPIGVILPLNGRYAPYGRAVLRGIECAAGIYRPCESDLPIRLIVRDSGANREQAKQAYEDMITTEYVLGVVGPLVTAASDTVAKLAEDYQVPTIILSQKEKLTEERPFVFRNFLTIHDQVLTLVNHLCDSGRRDIAMLYPETSLGSTYHDLFKSLFRETCEGTVGPVHAYDVKSGDFQGAVRGLKFAVAEHKLGKKLGFDAIFIPDSYKNLSRILPLLSFLEVDDVKLFGTAGWNNKKLVEEFPEVMEGAVFSSGFFIDAQAKATRKFTDKFRRAFDRDPSFLEIYGFDSVEMFKKTLRGQSVATRVDVREALAGIRDFLGASGVISFDQEGEAKRKLFLLTVENGKIQELH
jgi:branched-chain amino acid transport system substrate-binding protein